jgi:REP element-mobilizing transposase RayT
MNVDSAPCRVNAFMLEVFEMPRVNRTEICAADEIQVFHLINRCVRQTYLCGEDVNTGKDYSHRKEWIRRRLEELAGIFALDVMSFAVMSNHLHVVVRTRPDVVRSWSDDEIAVHWWRLFPQRRDGNGAAAEPLESELNSIRNDASGLKEKRRRLCDISWFMRCLAEPIARLGNKEDEVTGRFWEGRFKAQPLLDETAIVACMAYVDLNPIRAGIAATPETSDFTSVKERISDRQSAAEVSTADAQDHRIEHGEKAGWLAPIPLEASRQKVRERETARRADNKGCLPMTLDGYLKLLDWTGRQFRTGKRGRIPSACAPILDRLGCSAETWFDFVKNFRKRFRSEAGLQPSIRAFRSKRRERRSHTASIS